MESRMRKNINSIAQRNPPVLEDQYRYQKPVPHGLATAKKLLKPSYFSVESMVLVGLTASLLILPLVLPPLPPPPFMLLLLPIGILGLLLVIAFMHTKVRDLAYTQV